MQLPLFLALLPLAATCTNVVLSNDDGWAEINIRSFYNALTAAHDSVVLSAPTENKSGTGTEFDLSMYPCPGEKDALTRLLQVLPMLQRHHSLSLANSILVQPGPLPRAAILAIHGSTM